MIVTHRKILATRRGLFKGIAAAGAAWTAGQSAWEQEQVSPSAVPFQRDRKEGPGLGVTVDETLAAVKPFCTPGLQPRLNAPDGSIRDF